MISYIYIRLRARSDQWPANKVQNSGTMLIIKVSSKANRAEEIEKNVPNESMLRYLAEEGGVASYDVWAVSL